VSFVLRENNKQMAAAMIGKTRQNAGGKVVEVFDAAAGKARGVLKGPITGGLFRHSRRSPTAGLERWIAHYWMVSWDLRGEEPVVRETLPHPNVHVVFEEGNSRVAGVATGRFTRMLEGQSHVFGVKFRAGSFRPFLEGPVSSLTDRMVPVRSIFGEEVETLEAVLVSACEEDEMVEAANAFFRGRVPRLDEAMELAGRLVEGILVEPEIKTVDDLVERTGVGKRSLQRIFREYVGVSPKWVIRRYRLHEVVERLNAGEQMDGAALALELGYFDQAHLINDFRSMVGYSPVRYRGLIGSSSSN
jgi:AraC-like DNA-binding protein